MLVSFVLARVDLQHRSCIKKTHVFLDVCQVVLSAPPPNRGISLIIVSVLRQRQCEWLLQALGLYMTFFEVKMEAQISVDPC